VAVQLRLKSELSAGVDVEYLRNIPSADRRREVSEPRRAARLVAVWGDRVQQLREPLGILSREFREEGINVGFRRSLQGSDNAGGANAGCAFGKRDLQQAQARTAEIHQGRASSAVYPRACSAASTAAGSGSARE
jgi:hypothetical protein